MTEGTSSSVPIFLCCAEDSEVFLVRVVDALHKEGLAPEVIAGVEAEPSLLGEAVDRTEGAALFVLCQSDALDKVHTRRLTGLFSARKGPQQRIITLQLYESRPLSVLPGIRNGVKEVLKAGASEGKVDAGERVNLREVVGPIGAAAVQPAASSVPSIPRDDQLPDLDGIDDAEALARELHEEMVAAEAILARRESHRRSDASQPRVEGPLPVRSTPDQETRKEPAPPPADVSDDGREPGAPATLLDTQALATVPLAAEEPPIPADDDEADVGPEATDPLGRASQITGPNASTGSMVVPKRSRVGFVVAAGGVFALGLVALLYVGREHQPAGRDERPRSVVQASKDEAKADEPRANPASPEVDPVLPAQDEHREPGDASQGEPATPRGARPAPPPPPLVDSDAAAINEALGDGRMRALDTTLMLPAETDTMTWDGARDHCRQQRVAGIGDWRLPSKTELSRLRRARLIPIGPYWTRQKGDTDDEAFAWDPRSGQYVVWLTIEPNARAVCVRER